MNIQEGSTDTPAVHGAGNEPQQGELMRAIEAEVLPRLFLAHSVGQHASDPDVVVAAKGAIDATHIKEFAELLIQDGNDPAEAFVDTQMARGLSVERILIDLFAPAARELGDMWLRDECTFSEVTIGLCTLETLLMRHAGNRTVVPFGDDDHMALFAPLPGEQHVFGLQIVKELFRTAGWTVCCPASESQDGLLKAVHGEWFTMVGLSASRAESLAQSAPIIDAIRQCSCNPNIIVVVGGQFVGKDGPHACGADIVALDGHDGLELVERMVDERRERSLCH